MSMSIITQYTRRGQIHYPARKNMLGGGRGETGVLSMFLFSNQIIKLHTHTTCPLHHTILILFKVEGEGGEGSNLHSPYHINILKFFLVSAAMLTNLYLKRERYAKEVIVFRCCYCMYCYIVLVSPPPPAPPLPRWGVGGGCGGSFYVSILFLTL